MDTFSQRFIERLQQYKSKHFKPVGNLLLGLNLNANVLTTFSLISGLLATYFLFTQYALFILFILLHLLFDGLDGVVARIAGSTTVGAYYDHLSDGLLTILLLVKIGLFLGDYVAYVAVGIYAFSLIVHFSSKMKYPVLFTRTLTVLFCILYIPSVAITIWSLVIAYLISGIAGLFSLARQLQELWIRKVVK